LDGECIACECAGLDLMTDVAARETFGEQAALLVKYFRYATADQQSRTASVTAARPSLSPEAAAGLRLTVLLNGVD